MWTLSKNPQKLSNEGRMDQDESKMDWGEGKKDQNEGKMEIQATVNVFCFHYELFRTTLWLVVIPMQV